MGRVKSQINIDFRVDEGMTEQELDDWCDAVLADVYVNIDVLKRSQCEQRAERAASRKSRWKWL